MTDQPLDLNAILTRSAVHPYSGDQHDEDFIALCDEVRRLRTKLAEMTDEARLAWSEYNSQVRQTEKAATESVALRAQLWFFSAVVVAIVAVVLVVGP